MFIEPALLSIIISKIRGGSFKALEKIEFKGLWLLIVSGLLQFGLSMTKKFNPPFAKLLLEDFFIVIIGISLICLIAISILNFRKSYMKIFFIGIVLNSIVIMSNGGKMPVSLGGFSSINEEVELPERALDIKHVSVGKETKLIYLADIILIPRPYPLPKILSIGDLFIMASVFVFFQVEMDSRKRLIFKR